MPIVHYPAAEIREVLHQAIDRANIPAMQGTDTLVFTIRVTGSPDGLTAYADPQADA